MQALMKESTAEGYNRQRFFRTCYLSNTMGLTNLGNQYFQMKAILHRWGFATNYRSNPFVGWAAVPEQN